MKMTSRSKVSVRVLQRGVLLVALFFLCIVVLVWRSFFTGLLWQASTPLSFARNIVAAPFAFIQTSFSAKAALEAHSAALEAALASSTERLADRDVLYQENLDLKNRLGRDARLQTILVGVMMRPPEVPYDTLLIDAGSLQGIAVDDLVSAGGTTLVGRIAELHPGTASVVLYSAPGERYNGLLLTGNSSSTVHSSIPVALEGQGAGSLRAEVPAGTPAAKGDAIVSPGVVHGFVGTVSVVSKKDSESFETIYVTLPVNPQELHFVEIWKKEQ